MWYCDVVNVTPRSSLRNKHVERVERAECECAPQADEDLDLTFRDPSGDETRRDDVAPGMFSSSIRNIGRTARLPQHHPYFRREMLSPPLTLSLPPSLVRSVRTSPGSGARYLLTRAHTHTHARTYTYTYTRHDSSRTEPGRSLRIEVESGQRNTRDVSRLRRGDIVPRAWTLSAEGSSRSGWRPRPRARALARARPGHVPSATGGPQFGDGTTAGLCLETKNIADVRTRRMGFGWKYDGSPFPAFGASRVPVPGPLSVPRFTVPPHRSSYYECRIYPLTLPTVERDTCTDTYHFLDIPQKNKTNIRYIVKLYNIKPIKINHSWKLKWNTVSHLKRLLSNKPTVVYMYVCNKQNNFFKLNNLFRTISSNDPSLSFERKLVKFTGIDFSNTMENIISQVRA